MKHPLLFLAFSFAIMHSMSAQYKSENLKLDPSATVDKYTYQHLRLYPIRANHAFVAEHKNMAKYVTLEQALKTKKVTIKEESNDGTVNTLLIENTSND